MKTINTVKYFLSRRKLVPLPEDKKSNMLRFIYKHKKDNIIVIMLLFLITLFQTLSSITLAFATDELIKGNMKSFLMWNLISFLLWILVFIANYFEGYHEERTIQKISIDIRKYIVAKISATSFQNFYSKNEGTYISWLNNDIQAIEDKGLRRYYSLWGNAFGVVLSVIALVSYHYSLVLITFLLMGVLIKFPSVFEKSMAKSTEALSEENESFVSSLQDCISGYNVFFGFNIFAKLNALVIDSSNKLANKKVGYTKLSKVAEGSIGSVNIFSQVAVGVLTGILALYKVVTFGAISSTGNLASAIFNSVARGSSDLFVIKTVNTYFTKYRDFENKAEEKDIAIDFNSTLEVKNLQYSIGDKNIIKDLNFKLEKGRKYALVGESGSGKSTILNILAGRIENYNGEIYVDGILVDKAKTKSLRSIMNYVPQKSHIFNTTAENNITLWEKADKSILTRVFSKLGIDKFSSLNESIEEGGKNLSGGEKQRISFARALMNQRDIILLDESTANLDKETALALESIALDDPDSTVILVTHRLFEENIDKFDQIISLENARSSVAV